MTRLQQAARDACNSLDAYGDAALILDRCHREAHRNLVALRAALVAEQQQPTHEELIEFLRYCAQRGNSPTVGIVRTKSRALLARHDAAVKP